MHDGGNHETRRETAWFSRSGSEKAAVPSLLSTNAQEFAQGFSPAVSLSESGRVCAERGGPGLNAQSACAHTCMSELV